MFLVLTFRTSSVTSVGGTQGFEPEEAWGGSGGGFSNYYCTDCSEDVSLEYELDEL